MKNNPDLGHRLTDKELAELEKRIAYEYKKAADELTDKINAYFESFKKRDEEAKALIGTIVNGKEYTEQDYKQWRLAQIGRGKRFEAMRDRVAERMTNANEAAATYINDQTPSIYSLNRNYAAYAIEQVAGDVGFDLWDEQTVKRLLVEAPDLMPYYPQERAIKRGIDLAWGKKQITNQITSGILQGESVKHLADRLQTNIPEMNRNSAIRAARTAVTSAQNAGRQDSYDAAVKMGIDLAKRWVATLDGRARHDHAAADGQVVPEDEPFVVGGEKLMYPGDPSGSPWNIYNCRCTVIAQVKGVHMSDAKRRARDPETGESVLIEDMTYSEWAGWKQKIEANPEKKEKLKFNSIKDAETWATDSGAKYAIFKGFDVDTANIVCNAINTLPADVRPKSVTDLTTFKKGFGGKLQRKDIQIYGVTLDNLWGINFGDGMIDYDGGIMVGFNTRNYKNAAAITESKKKTNEAYFKKTGHMWHFNMSGEATYYHEIGHAYAEAKGIPKGFSEARQRWLNEEKCDILKTDGEAWAEAWAAYHLGDSRLPSYISKFIEEVL